MSDAVFTFAVMLCSKQESISFLTLAMSDSGKDILFSGLTMSNAGKYFLSGYCYL